MQKHAPATISLLALGSAIAVYPTIFLFYMIARAPEWAAILPEWVGPSFLISFLCLLPCAASSSVWESAKSASVSIVLSPIPALLIYSANFDGDLRLLVVNVVWHYLWVTMFHLLLPALLVVAAKYLVNRFAAKSAAN